MIKKLMILILCWVCLPLTAYAIQPEIIAKEKPDTKSSIGQNLRRLAKGWFSSGKVEWADQVAAEEHKVDSAAGAFQTSFYAITTTSYPQHPVCPKNTDKKACAQYTKLFKERMDFFQTLLQRNEVLAKYKFFVSHPFHLYDLNDAEMSLLGGFLSQPVQTKEFDVYYRPLRVSNIEAGVTEVVLKKPEMKPLVLRIDSKKKIVYFFHKQP